ncbi:uncharacterized protein BXZ73DRAFT_106108 [Epithele typhae]|uniref:uncharacterized protein n=1 Tax=Epithele typhae TaxID=378194 RepID=UPI002007743B|nr:uncharacterized protein BXZ73DRAFT_106108 [Epithele typhae]KAH9915560.1 hypothetical protein BXZ73DRAFT_106108 [Epithele typhae]
MLSLALQLLFLPALLAFALISAARIRRLSLGESTTKLGDEPTTSTARTLFRDRNSITSLLAPSEGDLPSLLAARAHANERFTNAFDIHSTFTSPSRAVHDTFVRRMKALIDSKATGCDVHLHPPAAAAQPFDKTVRAIVLHLVLVALLDADPAALEYPALDRFAETLNDLWTRSKAPAPIPPHLLAALQAQLRAWVPRTQENAGANHLEVIIPAYETMWRVVAVALAHVHLDPRLRAGFDAFGARPTADELGRAAVDGAPSAHSVVLEVLRLYPPTRRIARHVPRAPHADADAHHPLAALVQRFLFNFNTRPSTPTRDFDVLVADVEAAQREGAAWGPDPDAFDPRRWERAGGSPSSPPPSAAALLAFGHGRLKCVASGWAPGAAAAIVAGVLSAGARVERADGADAVSGGRDAWRGWSLVVPAEEDA